MSGARRASAYSRQIPPRRVGVRQDERALGVRRQVATNCYLFPLKDSHSLSIKENFALIPILEGR